MIEFLTLHELSILRYLHILAMVFWLGGEWGVFQTSFKVVDPELTASERLRHLDTVFRIDILARIGIVSLLPLGLHMGHLWGLQPNGGGFLVATWIVWVLWIAITLLAFRDKMAKSKTLFGYLEDWTRYILIPVLLIVGTTSLMGLGPFEAGDGQNWYAIKLIIFGIAFIVGLVLRHFLHSWPGIFAALLQGPDADSEKKLARSIRASRKVAICYWITILAAGFFGAVKPV
ncbi:hypothetical protein [Altererythrobacter sp. GH1-8]|uniref:hypothetical protein n=1 Tax=Altererythrobacter sp. GH1-8 TaxID=3349333 RepID=UPI00374D0F42